MKLGYDLHIVQTQKLTMTPELIQAIQILQYSNQELEGYIEEQLLSNPVLETTGDELQQEEAERTPEQTEQTAEAAIDWSEYLREYDDISYRQNEYAQKEHKDYDEMHIEQIFSSRVSLTEHLMLQVQMTEMDERCKEIAGYLVESLDKNGYLPISLFEIAETLGISEQAAEKALKIIHTFDPIGVGARDLAECLLIQVGQLGMTDPKIKSVIQNHLTDIAENRISNISRALGISCQEAQNIMNIIRSLEPKPGRKYSDYAEIRYIVPDVFVEKVDDGYHVTVNDGSLPRLYVSNYYRKILQEEDKDSTTSKFLSGRLNSAVWLIRSIEQRRQTILNVVQALVEYQKDFFDHGKKFLRPLTLKQVADEIGAHESTVSRAISGKYLQSPRGVYDMKYFFSSGVQGNMGQGVAAESVKTYIREMIAEEDAQKPISDQNITENLQKKGIDISRRTVAKYRDEINIPSSSKRKRL